MLSKLHPPGAVGQHRISSIGGEYRVIEATNHDLSFICEYVNRGVYDSRHKSLKFRMGCQSIRDHPVVEPPLAEHPYIANV